MITDYFQVGDVFDVFFFDNNQILLATASCC